MPTCHRGKRYDLFSLAAVDILSIATPGPNVLLVTQTAVKHGRTRAILAAIGIVAGSLFWAGLALTELAALFAILPPLQTALRVVGAAFLIYLGVQLLRTPHPVETGSRGHLGF
jgi:threonine efflux protein